MSILIKCTNCGSTEEVKTEQQKVFCCMCGGLIADYQSKQQSQIKRQSQPQTTTVRIPNLKDFYDDRGDNDIIIVKEAWDAGDNEDDTGWDEDDDGWDVEEDDDGDDEVDEFVETILDFF